MFLFLFLYTVYGLVKKKKEMVNKDFETRLRAYVASYWKLLCTMLPSLYHHEISGDITNDRREVLAKGQGQMSKIKVTEVKILFSRFQTVTPV